MCFLDIFPAAGAAGRGDSSEDSVQADHENRSFHSPVFARQRFGSMAIVVEHADPHPPSASWASKFRHVRSVIASREVVGYDVCAFFAGEGAHLHSPASPSMQPRAGLEQV